jgi:hypothetical protein
MARGGGNQGGRGVPEGKPLDDRKLEIPAFPDVVGGLMARPTRNTQELSFEDPGPSVTRGRVEVPVHPEGGR